MVYAFNAGNREVNGLEYTINKLSKISEVSTRTLRFYDEINLLKPVRISTNNYRIYGKKEVELLQQILFYRELGVSLSDIKAIVSAPDYEAEKALEGHLAAMLAKQEQLNLLIANVRKTISSMKGENAMSDNEKFEGFKQKMIDDNENQYGAEIRAKYGDETVNKSNAKIKGMSKEQYEKVESLTVELERTLKAAFEQGDPASELAQKACELHKQWLCCYYDKYNKNYHMGLAQMYVDDPRFTAHYDKIAVGCAEFLRDAVMVYCDEAAY